MAKQCMLQREEKRTKLVAKYSKKRKEILSDLHSEINNKIKKIDDIKNDDSDSEMKPEWEEINKNDISNNTSYWNSWFY